MRHLSDTLWILPRLREVEGHSDIRGAPRQRYLNIEDRKVVAELHALHEPVLPNVSRPFFPGMRTMRELRATKFLGAASLKDADIADPSFIDELERNGFIDQARTGRLATIVCECNTADGNR